MGIMASLVKYAVSAMKGLEATKEEKECPFIPLTDE